MCLLSYSIKLEHVSYEHHLDQSNQRRGTFATSTLIQQSEEYGCISIYS